MNAHVHAMNEADMIGEASVWPCGCSSVWTTMSGHPASGLRYQTMTIGRKTYGRVTKEGREVVSPAPDSASLYRQYMTRVNRVINEMETK